ncbi:MAG: hypothetical protein NTW21_11170 [Verrucomicrobia bacterium]|nr:hypothetical protein [Verrucomicrobiota bacterium]
MIPLALFTGTMDRAREVTGMPLGFLVRHRFDNPARLAALATHVTPQHQNPARALGVERGVSWAQ